MFFMSYKRDTKKRVIFFGDSITEQGMALNGYVSLINRKIEAEDLAVSYTHLDVYKRQVCTLLYRLAIRN